MCVTFLQLWRQTRVTVLFLGLRYTPVYGIPLLGHNTMHSFFKTLEEVYNSVKNTNKTLEKERSRNVVKALIMDALESQLLLK